MADLQLTFPVFYHCAVKKASPNTQYNAVNLLLTGSIKGYDHSSIPESTASLYVNGTKPLPKDMIYELLHLSDDALFHRLEELNFSDIYAAADAAARLLEIVSISPAAKEQLLAYHTEKTAYDFLAEVFRTALKNSAFQTVRLRKEDLALIQSCRNPAAPAAEPPAPQKKAEPAEKPLRNIGTLSPRVEWGKTTLTESILQYMTELDTRQKRNPLDPLGDYEEHLLIRTLHPSSYASREDLAKTFYSLLEGDSRPYLSIDYADLMAVVNGADGESLLVLEFMGEEEDVLHALTHHPRLRGAKRAAMISTLHLETSWEIMQNLPLAAQESMGHDFLIHGATLSADIGEGMACVRLLLAR